MVNEALFLGAKLLAFFAISLAPVSLVGVVGSTAVFFGMIGVTFFGLFLTPVFFVVIRKLTAPRPATETVITPALHEAN